MIVSIVDVLSGPEAYGQIVGGAIAGSIHHSTGAALPAATLKARQMERGVTRTITAASEAEFSAHSVPEGSNT